jgi:transcriptional regulator
MYMPAHFSDQRPEYLHRVIREHPLGALITHGPGGLDAEHIPFELDPGRGAAGTLLAHVARANPLWQRCPTGTPVLAIFGGAEGYISPNWYPTKHESHRQVPTWNYEVVHAHGVLIVHDDERFVGQLVARLTRHHEAGEPTPWKLRDSAPDFIKGLMKNIVGIEITITSLVGKAKLSQNKEPRDRLNAAERLQELGHSALAQAMRQL